jgi:hypothetical protein
VYYLTHFPIWLLLLFTVGGSFFATFLAVNSAGVTFAGFNIPYLKELMIYSSRWGGRDIWFAPVTMYTGGSNVAIAFGQADLLNANKGEYVRTFLIVVALGMFASFLFVSYLWNISPIPSGAYPATITDWPVLALNWARFQVWVFKGYIFKENLILWSFLGGAVVYVLTAMVLRKPYFLIAFITGTMFTSPISITLAQLIGSILARKIIAPMLDRSEPGAFNQFRGRFVMGMTIGWGFMELTRALLILVGRSMWLLPF